MPRWQRVYLTACAGLLAFALGYTLTDYARIPHLFYVPAERAFRLAGNVPGAALGYLGQWLWGALAAAAAAAATWVVAGRVRREASGRALGLAFAWAATAIVFAAGYFVWNNWP
ncbi:MAG TPA: hypothetical protein VKE22_04985 [Haliangiales bacterium]|nr:hypothetical protein [Haliangiales bacterium]